MLTSPLTVPKGKKIQVKRRDVLLTEIVSAVKLTISFLVPRVSWYLKIGFNLNAYFSKTVTIATFSIIIALITFKLSNYKMLLHYKIKPHSDTDEKIRESIFDREIDIGYLRFYFTHMLTLTITNYITLRSVFSFIVAHFSSRLIQGHSWAITAIVGPPT